MYLSVSKFILNIGTTNMKGVSMGILDDAKDKVDDAKDGISSKSDELDDKMHETRGRWDEVNRDED